MISTVNHINIKVHLANSIIGPSVLVVALKTRTRSATTRSQLLSSK